MPNPRRRKFSVQNDIATKEPRKKQNNQQPSHPNIESDTKVIPNNNEETKLSKHKINPNTSKNSSNLDISPKCSKESSSASAKNNLTTTIDQEVTASSSNIDLYNNILSNTGVLVNNDAFPPIEQEKYSRQSNKDRPISRRERYSRQHRIKVRSPKRRIEILDQNKDITDVTKQTTGTSTVNYEQEIHIYSLEFTPGIESAEEGERANSNHSLDDMCRICHGGEALSPEFGRLVSACSCRGTVGRVHVKCLERWLTESGKSRCELCGMRYETKRVHKYGVPRALVMWILSQNAKQLMVDSLGIILMSPLAVLAAWLSGRTLAGLMTHDQKSPVTPWPLASTFVLACMTLVCYYCWIVSAATRHALGWWIWYRSQYEVRLQLQDDEEFAELN